MGERKGQNHYYPPDFDPKKHGNLNAYHGTHALRERARKLDTQGILIIRFEMPYNIWCGGCKAHIAMGVRYNAEKKKVDMYYSTPIQEFRMKCHLCEQRFIIRTDPANSDYVILDGARRKEQRWSMKDNEQIVTDEKADIKRMKQDAMFGLEHETKDKSKVAKLAPTLRDLEEERLEWRDDYRLNAMMRTIHREEKKELNDAKKNDQTLLNKWNLDIELVKEHKDDVKLASMYKYNTVKASTSSSGNFSEKRKSIVEVESIFEEQKDEKEKKTEKEGEVIGVEEEEVKNKKQKMSSKAKKTELAIKSLKSTLSKSEQSKKLANSGLSFTTKFNNEKTSTTATPQSSSTTLNSNSIKNKLRLTGVVVVNKSKNKSTVKKGEEEEVPIDKKEKTSNCSNNNSNLLALDYGNSSSSSSHSSP